MQGTDYIILILGLIIGTLFGIGVTDWHILLKDEYKVTDWTVAICTISIVIGTLLAARYTKQSAIYAKKQLLANNLSLAKQIYTGSIKELNNFSYLLNDHCREIRNFAFKKYEPNIILNDIVPKIEIILNKLAQLENTLNNQDKDILFIMQNNNIHFVSHHLFKLKLNLNKFLDLNKYHIDDIDKLRQQAKKILEHSENLSKSLSPINVFFKHYFYQ